MNARNCLSGILLFASLSLSQQGWVWQNPLPQGNALHSVHFVDAGTGWAVGDFGTLLKTVNGGTSWSIQSSGTTSGLSSVSFVDANTGYVVGSNGLILKTSDGGTHWFPQTSGTSQGLTSVVFLNASTGYATGGGGVILKTTNGGTTWSAQTSGVNKNLSSVSFPDANTGFAVGDSGTILKTVNGGSSWMLQSSGTPYNLNSMTFLNDSVGWVAGNGTGYQINGGFALHPNGVFKTIDGGKTWVSQYSNTGVTNFAALHFVDANTGFLVVTHPDIIFYQLILKTTDGGTTWNSTGYSSNYPASICFGDSSTGYAVGSNGDILKTNNKGASWGEISSGNNLIGSLSSVHFVNANTGFAVGYAANTDVVSSAILKTSNGGLNWNIKGGSNNTLNSIDFLDSTIGYGAGYNGHIAKTVDGGSTWTNQVSGTSNTLASIQFLNSVNGFAVGASGTILHTTDGGNTWAKQTSGTLSNLNSVFFLDSTTGYAVGKPGTILKTTNGGNTWAVIFSYSGVATGFNSVYFANPAQGWLVGETGIILHTADSGKTWPRQTSGTLNALNAVKFTDSLTGYAVGTSGTLLETSDGGSHWIAYPSGTTVSLYSLSFADATHGWTVGDNGVILTTATMQPPTSLIYYPNSVLYDYCYTIPTLYPASNGAITAYTVSPALPAGIVLNPATGVISGTPTVIFGTTATDTITRYTITASNPAGSTQFGVNFTHTFIDDFRGNSLSYSTNPATYPMGKSITPNTPTSAGPCSVLGYSVSPALPSGLTFDSSTGIISGAPTTLVAGSNYVVTMRKAFATSVTNTIMIAVVNQPTGISSSDSKGLIIRFSNSSVLFQLPADIRSAQLSITDILGRNVWNRKMETGVREAAWNGIASNGSAVSSGIYFIRVQTKDNAGKTAVVKKPFAYAP